MDYIATKNANLALQTKTTEEGNEILALEASMILISSYSLINCFIPG